MKEDEYLWTSRFFCETVDEIRVYGSRGASVTFRTFPFPFLFIYFKRKYEP